MKVMLDLNVLLDVVQRREPHFGASAGVLAMAARGEVTALVSSHCLTTLYYIIAKHADRSKADNAVDWVLSTGCQPRLRFSCRPSTSVPAYRDRDMRSVRRQACAGAGAISSSSSAAAPAGPGLPGWPAG